MDNVTIEKFGKDHWSLLGYIECRCVESSTAFGELDARHLSCKKSSMWKPEYGTRLKGFFQSKDPNLQLTDHDDFDCLDDLENAGLIEILSMANLWISMTKLGNEVAGDLRSHKANGGSFANFEYRLCSK